MRNFGMLLRSFRQRCKDPDHSGRSLSQERFGELLGKEVGGGFSGAAISDWEREVSKIHADHRPVLINIIRVLKQCGGIADPTDANSLLNAGNYRALDQNEIGSIFSKDFPGDASSQNHHHQPSKLWPPGIPDEDYHPLPHREQQLLELMKLIESDNGPQLISIDGLGGIGKTSLAAEVARRSVSKGVFQGVIGDTAKQEILVNNEIIQLQASTLNYENLLDAMARQLQLWNLFTLDVKSKETILSQTLRHTRQLVFVDNLETAENSNALVSSLRNILGTSRAIVTSRVKAHFGFAHSFTLESLGLEDSLIFIHSIAERSGVQQILDADRKSLSKIFQLSGGSPLAMKLAIAQAKSLELDHILRLMRMANNNLYFFIFKESWEQLSESAQNILVYVGKTAVEAVSFLELSMAGLTINDDELIKALEQLITYSLLNVSYSEKQIRYGIHQLTRQFIIRDLPVIWKQQGML